jgi:hypothetical protein
VLAMRSRADNDSDHVDAGDVREGREDRG